MSKTNTRRPELPYLLAASAATIVFLLSSCGGSTTPETSASWEQVKGPGSWPIQRTETPTGWLVYDSYGLMFVPDPDHVWLAGEDR